MKYSDVLNGTFTGIVNGSFIAKDGRLVGFIRPTLPALCGAIVAWKVRSGKKKRTDGNIQFIHPRHGDSAYAEGNSENLRKNMFVEFQIRCDSSGLPQAYNIKPADMEVIPELPELKIEEAKAPVVSIVPEKLVSGAALSEAKKGYNPDRFDEDYDAGIEDELDDDDFTLLDEYDPDEGDGPRSKQQWK